MLRVRVHEGKVGLVYRNGNYKSIVGPGVHYLWLNENLNKYHTDYVYGNIAKLDVMLKDEKFRSMIELIQVKDNALALVYVNGNFSDILEAGRYFYFKGAVNIEYRIVDLEVVTSTTEVSTGVLQHQALANYVTKHAVAAYEEALLFVDGKYQSKLTKGTYYFWKGAVNVEVLKVDMRQLQMEVSGQEMLTADKAALRLNFYAQYKVVDAEVALLNNKDYEKQLYILLQLALREYVGTRTLDELLDSKDTIAELVVDKIKDKVALLGIQIVNTGIRDVILPGEVKQIMNQVLVAQKQAQANTITRREETASTRSLLNTAKLMEENDMLFKLKEMEYMEKIADKIGEITVSGNGKVLDQLRDIFSKN